MNDDAPECPNVCDDGKIWNNNDPTSGQWVPCDGCEGETV